MISFLLEFYVRYRNKKIVNVLIQQYVLNAQEKQTIKVTMHFDESIPFCLAKRENKNISC